MTADRDRDRRRSARPLVSVLVVVSGGVGITMQQLGTGTPPSAGRWVMLVAGSVIGGAASILATGLFERLLTLAGAGWSFLRGHTRRRTVLVLLVACALAVGAGFVIPPGYGALDRWLHGCGQPAAVRVLTSVEQLDATVRIAEAYERSAAGERHGCPPAELYVYPAAPADARAAVASGWLNDALRRIGPRADVWLPDTSLDVAAALDEAARLGVAVPVAERRTVGYTPVVLAAPVEAGLLADDRDWRQLWTDSRRLGWDVVRPDPAVSATGVLATAALYAGLGATPGEARAVEQRLERSLDRGGYPLGTSAQLLCHRGVAAVVTTEQAAVRYNQGLGCPGGGPPERPLVVRYPTDTLSEDHPFVRLAWPGVAAATRTAAAAFGAWLGGPDGRRAVLRAGLRPPGLFAVADPLSEQFGAQPGAVFDRRAPAPAAVAEVLRAYDQARRPGRVLLALDASGSMQTPAGPGVTRFQLASRGVTRVLDLMSDRDEFGLRVFPADGRGAGARELVPVGTAAGRKQSAADALAAVRPAGGTPLHQSIIDGVRDVAGLPDPDERVASVVVLTDGSDTGGRPPSEVDTLVAGKGVRVFVVTIGEASCGALPLRDTVVRTGGGCYDAGPGTLDEVLGDLFGLLWGGDGTP